MLIIVKNLGRVTVGEALFSNVCWKAENLKKFSQVKLMQGSSPISDSTQMMEKRILA